MLQISTKGAARAPHLLQIASERFKAIKFKNSRIGECKCRRCGVPTAPLAQKIAQHEWCGEGAAPPTKQLNDY